MAGDHPQCFSHFLWPQESVCLKKKITENPKQLFVYVDYSYLYLLY